MLISTRTLTFVCLIAINGFSRSNGNNITATNITSSGLTINNNDVNSLNNEMIYPIDVRFLSESLKMDMDNITRIEYSIHIDKSLLAKEKHDLIDRLRILMSPITISPQIKNIELYENKNPTPNHLPAAIHIDEIRWDDLNTSNNFTYHSSIILKATYIGHATINLESFLILKSNINESIKMPDGQDRLKITISKREGLLDKIFMYSVIIFITISYVNLGAQIDTDNMRRLIKAPKIIFFGFIIGSSVMPMASWLAGHIFFEDQPMFRIGSFIYASGPAASASVLWTVMFDADKELALGLQIASTMGALITMPIFLFALDKSIDLEGSYTIKVPYVNLARTLVSLSVALIIGSYLIGRHKRAKQLSQRIFRPLTMFVLLFIVVFSSIVYWYVYKMFDMHITLMAISVTSATYLISGFLGYLLNRDINQMVTMSISSTFRNSGIAFAALVVAFQQPDVMIAYVPCLTQVVTTSLIGLVLYLIKSLKNQCENKKQQLTIT